MSQQRALTHPRDEIMQTMDRIYRDRMTTTSGGNLSVRDPDGDLWISPARVDKGNLTRRDIVRVRSDGTAEGLHPPSSELPFHQAVYDARPDLNAIVHAHPVALVAFSISRQIPNTRLFHQAHCVCGRVGFAPYACPGSDQLGRNIAEVFEQGCDSVILENHGVVVGGKTLPHAFERFEALEFAGKTLIEAASLGEVRYLDDDQLRQAAQRGVDFDSFDPGVASEQECELRKQLGDFVRRGCRQRLLISTEGSFSARVSGQRFLITPTQRDRQRLQPEDLVLVDGTRREAGKHASRAAKAHQALYHAHSQVQAIVFAHPVHATALSVTDSTFDIRTIPESYVFLRDVQRIPFGTQYGDAKMLPRFVSLHSPAALLDNDGVIVTGSSVLDAFDRLEVLESTAEAILSARMIGEVQTMGDEVIDELQRAFPLPEA